MGHIPDPKRIEIVDVETAAILRTKTPAECLEMVFALNRAERTRIAEHVRKDHPDWSDGEIERGVGLRMCPELREIQHEIARNQAE